MHPSANGSDAWRLYSWARRSRAFFFCRSVSDGSASARAAHWASNALSGFPVGGRGAGVCTGEGGAARSVSHEHAQFNVPIRPPQLMPLHDMRPRGRQRLLERFANVGLPLLGRLALLEVVLVLFFCTEGMSIQAQGYVYLYMCIYTSHMHIIYISPGVMPSGRGARGRRRAHPSGRAPAR